MKKNTKVVYIMKKLLTSKLTDEKINKIYVIYQIHFDSSPVEQFVPAEKAFRSIR